MPGFVHNCPTVFTQVNATSSGNVSSPCAWGGTEHRDRLLHLCLNAPISRSSTRYLAIRSVRHGTGWGVCFTGTLPGVHPPETATTVRYASCSMFMGADPCDRRLHESRGKRPRCRVFCQCGEPNPLEPRVNRSCLIPPTGTQ